METFASTHTLHNVDGQRTLERAVAIDVRYDHDDFSSGMGHNTFTIRGHQAYRGIAPWRRRHDQGKLVFTLQQRRYRPGLAGRRDHNRAKRAKKLYFLPLGRSVYRYSFPPRSNVPPPVSTPIYGVSLPCFFLPLKDGVVALQKVIRDLGGGMRAGEKGNGRRRRWTPAPFFDIFDIFLLFTAHDLLVAASFQFSTLVVILCSTRRSGRA